MGDENEQIGEVRLNPRLCSLLRNPQPLEGSSPVQPSLQQLVGRAAVQRLQQANHQLAVQDFLKQHDATPNVPQDVALGYYARRAINSLRSREMLAREAKEAARLRPGFAAMSLAKDISRRHFRTAHRYDTGSKYPRPGLGATRLPDSDPHCPAARQPLLTLLRSRKLLAMANVLLDNPRSVTVGPQPQHVQDAAGGSAGASPNELGGREAASGQDLAAPSLDATLYALALFSPRSGYRTAPDADIRPDQGPRFDRGQQAGRRRTGGQQTRRPPVSDAAGEGGNETPPACDGGDGPGRVSPAGRADVGTSTDLDLADAGCPDAEVQRPDLAGEAPSARALDLQPPGAHLGGGQRRRDAPTAAGTVREEAGVDADGEEVPQRRPASGATPVESWLGLCRAGGALPVAVQQRLLGDELRELLAASRGLAERAESVLLGAGTRTGTEDGGLDGWEPTLGEETASRDG